MKNRTKGILWLLSPLFFLVARVFVAVLYFPVNGVLTLFTSYGMEMRHVNYFLKVTDYINLGLLFVGIIVGVYYLTKKKKENK
jgi:hypothetical protein